jgi:hypothetical protein
MDCGRTSGTRRAARGKSIMAQSFLPVTDAGLLAWAQNFYAVANPIATSLGLTTTQLTAFNTLVTTYSTSLAACDPGVRNKAAVFTKNQAKANLAHSCRLLAKIVEGQASVTDAQKTTLGLNVRATPTPIPPPAYPPQVDVLSVSGRTVSIRLHNSTVAGTRGKPPYVKGASVFSHVGATAPTDPNAYKFEGNTTRTRVDVTFPDSVAPGATVWITAFWFNERTQSGPAATPVQAVIQYGMTMVG